MFVYVRSYVLDWCNKLNFFKTLLDAGLFWPFLIIRQNVTKALRIKQKIWIQTVIFLAVKLISVRVRALSLLTYVTFTCQYIERWGCMAISRLKFTLLHRQCFEPWIKNRHGKSIKFTPLSKNSTQLMDTWQKSLTYLITKKPRDVFRPPGPPRARYSKRRLMGPLDAEGSKIPDMCVEFR